MPVAAPYPSPQIEDLDRLATRYLWVQRLSVETTRDVATQPLDAVRVSGILRAGDYANRAGMLTKADEFLTAVEDAGWWHLDHPHVDFRGSTRWRIGDPRPQLISQVDVDLLLCRDPE